ADRHGRRRRHDHQRAEPDQRRQRHQRPAVDGPPPLRHRALIGAGVFHGAPGKEATSARNASPRASKSVNWSNDAQAGDSSTMPRSALAAAKAAATALSSVTSISCGTAPPSVAAKSGAAWPIRKARRMRGKNGASSLIPPSFGTPPAIQ